MITVTKEEDKKNNKGPWMLLTYTNDKGEEKTTNIFGKIVSEQYRGLGKYEVKWIQKGNYYNVDGMELVGESQKSAAPPSRNGISPVEGSVDIKALLSSSAMQTAGEVVASMVAKGLIERKEVETYVLGYYVSFADEQAKWMKGGTVLPKSNDSAEGA